MLQHPELGRRIVDQGHELGVHGWNHRPLPCRRPGRIGRELAETCELIAGIRPRWYRTPYGVATAGTLWAACRRGLRPVWWNRWGRDWERHATPWDIAHTVIGPAGRPRVHGGQVILLHDSDRYGTPGSWRATAAALPIILRHAASRGPRVGALGGEPPDSGIQSAVPGTCTDRPMTGSLSRRRLLTSMDLLTVGAVGCSSGPPDGADPTRSNRTTASPTRSSTSSSDAVPTTVTTAAEHRSTAPVASEPPAPAVEISHVDTARPEVALTFHGPGDPETARTILGLSASRGVHITVLAVGTWLQTNPALAQAILAGGHDLGNHTWSRPVLSDLSEADVRDEITRCRDLLIQLTGAAGPFFRTSSGQHATDLMVRVAGESGYPICLSYDIDSTDWTDPGPEAVRADVAAATAGSIVSLHFGHPGPPTKVVCELGKACGHQSVVDDGEDADGEVGGDGSWNGPGSD